MSPFAAWWHNECQSTGIRIGRFQVDLRWGRPTPWLPLFVRVGRNKDFGRVMRLHPHLYLTIGRISTPTNRKEKP